MIRILFLVNKIYVYIVVDLMIKSILWLVKKFIIILVIINICNVFVKYILYVFDVILLFCFLEWFKLIDMYSCFKNILVLFMFLCFRYILIVWWNNC